MNDFDKTRRLLKKNDFNNVFNQAKKIETPEFIILYKNNQLGHARLGMALSKKRIAKSHDRNRLKRLLRETFRINKQLPAVDIVVLAKSGVGKVKNAMIFTKLGQAWNKLAVSYKN